MNVAKRRAPFFKIIKAWRQNDWATNKTKKVVVKRLRFLSHQDVFLRTPGMATSDKMDLLARRRCVFFSMKYFIKKKRSLSSVCLQGESLYGRMKMSLFSRGKNMCLHCVLHHRATLEWLSFISSLQQCCPLMVFLLFDSWSWQWIRLFHFKLDKRRWRER
jgi:hypothetical protein